MDPTTATHTDAGVALVTIEDMTKVLETSTGPDFWKTTVENLGKENTVLMANIMAATMSASDPSTADGYIRGFIHCYMALRNAEERCRKERT